MGNLYRGNGFVWALIGATDLAKLEAGWLAKGVLCDWLGVHLRLSPVGPKLE